MESGFVQREDGAAGRKIEKKPAPVGELLKDMRHQSGNYPAFIRRCRSKPEMICVPAVGLPGEQSDMATSNLGSPLLDVAGSEDAVQASKQPGTQRGEMESMVPGKLWRIYRAQPLAILIPVAKLGASDVNSS